MTNQIKVNTERYKIVHGRLPRGRGYWGIEINGEVYWVVGTRTDAVREAITQALAKGQKVKEAVILP